MSQESHIEKVMVLAVTGHAFDTDVEEGGHGVKIGLFRCQAPKLAKKEVRESARDETGQLRYNGPVVREKGDVYMVDTSVTGSNSGSADNPKFTLLDAFKYGIFPKLKELVGPGGPYEGFTPVIQGDNAGPHQDATFSTECNDYCNSNSMYWEPQAPQMPYVNNLDLAVFPAMSKAHSRLLAGLSTKTVASKDETFDSALSVWRELTSAKIAHGYILELTG